MKFLEQILDPHRNSEAVAIRHAESVISYAELCSNVKALSRFLMQNGMGHGDRAVIYKKKSISFVLSIFSVLNSGGAYIPVDNETPVNRLQYIIANSKATFLITDSEERAKALEVASANGLALIVIEENLEWSCSLPLSEERLACVGAGTGAAARATCNRSGKDLAYMIYTSGSTGKPKGVMIRHESVIAFTKEVTDIMQYGRETRFLNVSPLYFDACVVDLFCTLQVGGCVVLMDKVFWPNEILEAIETYRITDTLMASSILKLLVSDFSDIDSYDLSSLKSLWYGAESCPVDYLRKIKEYLPGIQFIHGYGPTETTHSATIHRFSEIDPGLDGFMPIGKPLDTVKAFAMNEAGQVIGRNEIGELYLGGIQVMEGYCDDEERTAKVLVADPRGSGEMYYKTGDFVTLDENGDYVFVNRRDDAVKTGGNLVYTSEVEKALLSFPAIDDAFVLPYEDDLFNVKLKAVVVSTGGEINQGHVVSHMKGILQAYMLPHRYVFLKDTEVPRTANGKADKNSLKSL